MVIPVGESVSLDGGRIVIHVKEKSGRQVRLSFTADADVSIDRQQTASNGAKAAQLGIRVAPAASG